MRNTGQKIGQIALLLLLGTTVRAQDVFINEFIYDSKILVDGKFESTVGQLVEVAGPAGTSLNNWTLVLYNGSTNSRVAVPYGTKKLTGTIPDQENGYGTLAFSFPANTLENGPNDGFALVDAAGKVVQLLGYEGTFTAGSGLAKGLVADRIGPSHSSTNGKQSLQLKGKGRVYKDFTWSALYDYTPGEVNNLFINDKQTFLKPQ